MNKPIPGYQGLRFPSEMISHAVWPSHRFCLTFREVEELLARGVRVTYETVLQWCQKFGPDYARQLKKRHDRLGNTWPIDEVFATIQGQRQDRWCAVHQDGDGIDILLQRRPKQRVALNGFSVASSKVKVRNHGGWSPTNCEAMMRLIERSCPR